MTLALLFPGQGTQHEAMLPWLDSQPEAAATLALMAARIGPDWRHRLGDSAWASGNLVAQCLLTGLGAAAWQCLAARLPAPAVVAGYSVGELPAFCAAGVFGAATALRLAGERAAAMQAGVAGLDTGLLALQDVAPDRLAEVSARHGLAVAIRIAADRVVLGGPAAALAGAQTELDAAGARCTRLPIALASHTPWMAAAAQTFARQLAPLPFAPPHAALVCNFSGTTLRTAAELKQALAGQIARGVPWDRCMDAVAERGTRCVLELGPGSSLARLWNEFHPEVPARSIDEFRGPDAVARWVRGVLG